MRALLPQLSKIAIFNKSGEPSFEEHPLCFAEHLLYKFTSFFNDILPTHKWKVQTNSALHCGISPLEANITLFKTEELFLINYPGLLTPDLGCIYHEYS